MSEQLTGVETASPDEEFDPDVALHLIAEQVAETCDELWMARLTEAGWGSWNALDKESPADGSEYEEAMLDLVKDFVGDQLDLFREQGLAPLILDPETQNWYRISGVGINIGLLSLVAVVHDPQDPTGTVTKLLGPGTDLAYTDTTAGMSGDVLLEGSGQVNLLPAATLATIGHLPLIAIPNFLPGFPSTE